MGDQPTTYLEVFRKVEEDPVFLADLGFEWHLHRLKREGLAANRDHRWWATGGQRSRRLPRWLGGYEIRDESLRWDPSSARLV